MRQCRVWKQGNNEGSFSCGRCLKQWFGGVQVEWYALVASAEFMLHDVQNEAFPEQLRERKRLYGELERPLDFFLVCEPAWLDSKFPEEAKKVRRPSVALISTDKMWIV